MDIKTALHACGLSNNQITVYTILLGLGEATVYKIAQLANLPRSTCYQVVDSLAREGFIASHRQKEVLYYSAESPENLMRALDQKRDALQEVIPNLIALHRSAQKHPSVRLYESKKAVGNILQECLDEADEICAISSSEEDEALGAEFASYLKARIEKKIPIKLIISESNLAYRRKDSGPEELRSVKILPSQYKHHNLVFLWKNKAAIFTLQGNYTAIIIEDRALTGFYRTLFSYLWDTLPR